MDKLYQLVSAKYSKCTVAEETSNTATLRCKSFHCTITLVVLRIHLVWQLKFSFENIQIKSSTQSFVFSVFFCFRSCSFTLRSVLPIGYLQKFSAYSNK